MSTKEEIMVSICCLTYNHEKYIVNALDGFLMQETDFKFEVLIHDDASTDRTAAIIRPYEQKYPEIIKPIYQTENQYSQGVKISAAFNYPRAKGKYIAICEGDDYWIDSHKLQKQVDYMEQNQNCTFCFHNAFLANDSKGQLEEAMVPRTHGNKIYFSNKNRKYEAGELQLLGFIPTASFLFPKKVIDYLPSWYLNSPAGDIATKLLATSYGYAYYINEKMSVYRINVSNSMMDRWRKEDSSKLIKRMMSYIETLDGFDKWTYYKYTNEINKSKRYFEFRVEIATNNKKVFTDDKYKEYFQRLSIRNKIRFYVKCRSPKVVRALGKVLPAEVKHRLLK